MIFLAAVLASAIGTVIGLVAVGALVIAWVRTKRLGDLPAAPD